MMGREVRMVPKNWEHPKKDNGEYIPLFEGPFELDANEWDKECIEWNSGNYPDYASEENKKLSYSEWNGERPEKCDYMTSFKDEEKTHLMMYETTTEGTPISPAFKTPEELARWLADNNASAFGSSTATYEQWLSTCKSGFAPSAVYTTENGLQSGVEALL